jgi:DNA-binding CsgD family transcriptional regulator/pimeloyl-ACP methyl ester carboxylesterase
VGFFQHGGRRVAYATLGSGPPLLCDLGRLHHLDLFWHHPAYRRLLEALGSEFSVIQLDRPGCGLSDRSLADFTLAAEVALFERLLDQLRLDRTAILASASASPVMIAVAAMRPELVTRLALFGPWACGHPQGEPYLPALRTLLSTQFDLAVSFIAQWAAAGCDSAVVEWLAGAYGRAASGEVIAQWLNDTVHLDVRPLLARVSCPTLVLHRRGDRAIDFSRGRDVAAGIPGAALLPLDGAPSLIWEGDTEPVLEAVRSFLSQGSQRSQPSAPSLLTPRQREVAHLVALGLSNAEIGERLGIGRRTVESHLERVRLRLGLSSRAQLAAWSMRNCMEGEPPDR